MDCFQQSMLNRFLFRICYRTCLADNRYLNLSWVGHLVLYLCCYLSREFLGVLIIHLVCTYDYTQFATGLNCIGLCNTWITHCYCLKVVESLDVSLYNLTTCTWTCTADGITHLNNRRKQCLHLHLVVVSADGIADVWFLLIFPGSLPPRLTARNCIHRR